MPKIYRDADLLVLPSTDGESFGIPILEALASGVPVVASDIPGYRSTLQSSPAGVLFPSGDAERLAEILVWLYSEPQTLASMAAHARRSILPFDWNLLAVRTEALYDELLALRSRQASSAVEGVYHSQSAKRERLIDFVYRL